MALTSIWYYTNLPEDIVNIIERDLTENFDPSMGDSKLFGDALNKEKRNSQNTWIPTTHIVPGVSHLFFMLSMIQKFILPQHLYVLGKIQELIPQLLYVLKISKKVH
jgi:hypothetical protein